MATYKKKERILIEQELSNKLRDVQKKVETELGIKPSIPQTTKIVGKMLGGKDVVIKKEGRKKWRIIGF